MILVQKLYDTLAIFGGYNSFIGFKPATQRGVDVLNSTPTTVDVPNIGFGHHDAVQLQYGVC